MARRPARSKASTFAADVGQWAIETDKRMTELPREAARIAAEEMREPKGGGGNMPVVTGHLSNSLAASLSGMPPVDWSKNVTVYPDPTPQVEGVVAQAQIGQVISLGFRAPYAKKVEQVHGFVRRTAQRWSEIVSRATARVKAQFGGG